MDEMDESDWRDLFKQLHIRVKPNGRERFFNAGRVLQHQGGGYTGAVLEP